MDAGSIEIVGLTEADRTCVAGQTCAFATARKGKYVDALEMLAVRPKSAVRQSCATLQIPIVRQRIQLFRVGRRI